MVVTGGSSGIGAAAARQLAARGAHLIVVGRDPDRTRAVADSVNGTAILADMARLDDVEALATQLSDQVPRVDALLLNAGGLFPTRRITEDGFEETMQVNLIAHFYLLDLLMPTLLENARTHDVRVVTTSSAASNIGRIRLGDLTGGSGSYHQMRTYANAKLAVVMMTRELARRTAGSGLRAYSVHPGVVASSFAATSRIYGPMYRSKIARHMMIDNDEGARPLVHLAADDLTAPSGTYFHRFQPDGRTGRQAKDPARRAILWDTVFDALAASRRRR